MTRPVLLFFVAFLFHVSSAWVLPPVHPRHSVAATPTVQFLRTDQAKELEECAFDLMKQALEEEQQALKKEGVLTTSQKGGPWAWCLKHLPGRAWWTSAHNNSSVKTALKP